MVAAGISVNNLGFFYGNRFAGDWKLRNTFDRKHKYSVSAVDLADSIAVTAGCQTS